MPLSRERYLEAYHALVYENRQLTKESLESVVAVVDRYKLSILEELADRPGDVGLLTRLQVIYDGSENLNNRFRGELSTSTERMRRLVESKCEEMLFNSNVEVPNMLGISENRLELISLKQTTLVRSLTTEHSNNLVKQIQNLVLAGVTENTQQDIAATLPSKLNFSSIYSRAKAIMITELGDIGNAAALNSINQAQQYSENVVTVWKHSMLPTVDARPAHLALDGHWKRQGEQFVVNGQYCYGPHDPNLTASEVVHCGCFAIPDVIIDGRLFGDVE